MLRVKFALALSILLTTGFMSFAQKSEEDRIRDVVKAFTADVAALRMEGSAKAEEVMNYSTPTLLLETKVINIMNIVTSENYDLKAISLILNQMRAADVSFKRTLGALNIIFVRENLAYARYENKYELFESERLINRGTQYVDLIFRKDGDGAWKIDYMRTLELDDLEFKGMCICEIYENQGLKNIMTETIVPNGSTADVVENKFSVDESIEPRIVHHGYRDYQWSTNGQIFRRNFDGSQGEQLGTAKNRQELILFLMKNEIYPDRCNSVVVKLK